MRYVFIPKGISKPIFDSQVVNRFRGSEIKFVSYDKNQDLVLNLSDLREIRQGDILYFRSVTDFIQYKTRNILRRLNVTTEFDFRGIISEESFLRNRSITRRFLLRCLEFFAYKYSDKVYAVSENLSKHLKNEYAKKSIAVIPCCLPTVDCVMRKSQTASRAINFIYVGSMSQWQSFDKVCQLYSSIQSEMTSFTVVTKDIDEASRLLSKYNVKAKLFSGSKTTVIEELDKADFGFIYRDDSIINITASPVKFLEYTARGVIPIMTPYVGDYSEKFADVAYVTTLDACDLDIVRLRELMKDQTIHNKLYRLTTQFTWDNYHIE